MDADDIQFAYLAGIIDGEGTVTIHCHRQYNRPTSQLRPRLIVSNTDQRMLKEIQHRHGGTVIPNSRKRRPGYKDVFLWRVAGANDLLFLLERVRPFLIIKARVADIMIGYLKSRLATRKDAAMVGITSPAYTPYEVDAYERIRDLNNRGMTKKPNSTTRPYPRMMKASYFRQ